MATMKRALQAILAISVFGVLFSGVLAYTELYGAAVATCPRGTRAALSSTRHGKESGRTANAFPVSSTSPPSGRCQVSMGSVAQWPAMRPERGSAARRFCGAVGGSATVVGGCRRKRSRGGASTGTSVQHRPVRPATSLARKMRQPTAPRARAALRNRGTHDDFPEDLGSDRFLASFGGSHLAVAKAAGEAEGAPIVTTRVLQGAPAPTIVDFAQAGPFDLVVMGTRGRTGIRHAFVGSVAEKVVRHSSCPVLTVRARGEVAEALST